ncbi:MAG: hypothetical protein IT449_16070 [Phycisphaerales bacterium]|nr:hypothetical protein [Phycisphaerales bacterium]
MLDIDRIRANVPKCLLELNQWVAWKYIVRDGRETKIPINARTGEPADHTNPKDWTSFDESVAACRRFTTLTGVGFVFSEPDPFCGVDLDDCIDRETGAIKAWGLRIVRALDSYSEISPSGGGVKVYLRARKPGARCRKPYEDGEVEMYDHARFFAITGQRIDDVSRDVEDRQTGIDALYAEVFGSAAASVLPDPPAGCDKADGAPALTDDEIIAKASSGKRAKKSGEKFAALLAGRWNEYFNSKSEADSSVCFTLAWYTKDAAQIDRIVRRSRLFREKWDEPRGDQTYGQITIANALANVTGQYRPRRRCKAPSPAPKHDAGPPKSLPPLYQPDEVARCFLETHDRMIYWRGVFHMYFERCYRILAEAELGARIARYITDVGWWCRPARKNKDGEYEDGAVAHPDYDGLMVVLEKPCPKNYDVREIMLQLKRDFLADIVEAPCWLDGASGPPADELVPCKNGLLHLPTGKMQPLSELLFSLNAVDYDYNASATAPGAWLEFLHQLFDDDIQGVEALQELFGYFLLPDTRQHKIGLIVGPKRGGKGTISRVLTRVLGSENVCGPTLGSLSTNFGLWPLLHKRLAIIADARLSGRTDQAVVVERLLSISGEDSITVDRKHLSPWTGKLPTRFLILTNELPKLTDVSGALASRFIMLCLTKSWYGREDHELTDRLLEELPGILNWSIAGWRRLNERGHFVQPESSAEALQELEDLSSPIRAFVRQRCEIGPGLQVEVESLYGAWQDYCGNTGRDRTGTIQSFGRDLRAAYPSLRVAYPRVGTARVRYYEGIALRPDEEVVRNGSRSFYLHA